MLMVLNRYRIINRYVGPSLTMQAEPAMQCEKPSASSSRHMKCLLVNGLFVILFSSFGCDEPPSCPDCEIPVARSHALELNDQTGFRVPFTRVLRSADGRFFVAPTTSTGQIAVFDSSGRFVQSIGRFGPGPGELGTIRDMAFTPAGDLVVSEHLPRLTVFDSTLRFRGVISLPATPESISSLPDGRVIVSIPVRRTRNSAIYVARLNEAVSMLAKDTDRDTISNGIRTVAVGAGRIWAAHIFEYRIDSFDEDRKSTRLNSS